MVIQGDASPNHHSSNFCYGEQPYIVLHRYFGRLGFSSCNASSEFWSTILLYFRGYLFLKGTIKHGSLHLLLQCYFEDK